MVLFSFLSTWALVQLTFEGESHFRQSVGVAIAIALARGEELIKLELQAVLIASRTNPTRATYSSSVMCHRPNKPPPHPPQLTAGMRERRQPDQGSCRTQPRHTAAAVCTTSRMTPPPLTGSVSTPLTRLGRAATQLDASQPPTPRNTNPTVSNPTPAPLSLAGGGGAVTQPNATQRNATQGNAYSGTSQHSPIYNAPQPQPNTNIPHLLGRGGRGGCNPIRRNPTQPQPQPRHNTHLTPTRRYENPVPNPTSTKPGLPKVIETTPRCQS